MNGIKTALSFSIGTIGAFIANLFGGWSAALTTLIIFMAIDYLTGFLVAAVFKKSGKSENGSLSSLAGWKGLCRKGCALLVVLVACRLDILLGTNFVRDCTVIAFCTNEAISILENSGLMGLPIPKVLTKAIDALKNKENDDD